MRRIHKPTSKAYRPFVGEPYEKVFKMIADELNKTSLHTFNDLSALRLAGYELWKRVFPDKPFPPEADILRTPYHKDPGV